MNDNEIIKALKHLRTSTLNGWREKKITEKDLNTISYALDLINRQKAEIERLTASVEAAEDYLYPLPFKNAFDDEIAKARAEAIREFAEKLKQEDFDRCIDVVYDGSGDVKRVEIRQALFNKQIDTLVKEMTESEVEE